MQPTRAGDAVPFAVAAPVYVEFPMPAKARDGTTSVSFESELSNANPLPTLVPAQLRQVAADRRPALWARHMKLHVLAADQAEARLYELGSPSGPLTLVATLSDPIAHQHDRDLKSDRPGRVFDHASAAGQRRGATGHHSTGGQEPRKLEAHRFASRVIAELEQVRDRGQLERVIVMAAPHFLGLLREAMPPAIRALVFTEVHKDLIKATEGELRAHLPPDAWHHQLQE